MGVRRVRIPLAARGLLRAVRLAESGDPIPFEAWRRSALRPLAESLQLSGFRGHQVDDAVIAILESAFRSVRYRRAVENELAWMSGIAWRVHADEFRRKARETRALLRAGAEGRVPSRTNGEPDSELGEIAFRAFRDSVGRLGTPYREAAILFFAFGWAPSGVAEFLQYTRGMGRTRAIRVLGEAKKQVGDLLRDVYWLRY